MSERVAVIGLGLIGGSLAAALRRSGCRVHGFDVSSATVRRAVERELVDEGHQSLASAVGGTNIVLLAAPVSAIVALLPEVETHSPDDALILDTGSVKQPVVEAMTRLRAPNRAVGGHPLAGKEISGPDAAAATLFEDHTFVLTPSALTSEGALSRAARLVRSLGSRPVLISPEVHDRVLARTSHLPQLASTALAISLQEGDVRLAGPALADMTRLARSDESMWRDILLSNRENVLAALDDYRDRLDDLAATVRARDGAGLARLFGRGREAAADLVGSAR